jgi:hypothetical protein
MPSTSFLYLGFKCCQGNCTDRERIARCLQQGSGSASAGIYGFWLFEHIFHKSGF